MNEDRLELIDLEKYIMSFGFDEDEIDQVNYELCAYRSIPGTNMSKYIRRVISNLDEEERPAFLKGLMIGTIIRTKNEEIIVQEDSIQEEVKRIDDEIKKLIK